ncbi:MAG: AI-2E family transporter YdiK [Burkholderiales bacterium]
MTSAPRRDLARTTLVVLAIGGLIATSLWILKPFLPALIWAIMIVVATWPLLLGLQKRLWRQRWLAVSVLMIALVLAFVLPFWLAISAVVANAEEIGDWAKSLATLKLPLAPDWVRSIPFVGEKIYAGWTELASSGPEELARLATPYARDAMHWFAAEVGSFGLMAVQLPLTLVIAGVLYFWGEASAENAHRFGRRLAGERGERAISLAGRAIRAVAFGVVLTALAQSVLGGVALAVAGVPFAGILTSVMFLLALAQIGAVPVLLCAAAWLYWKGSIAWMVALIVWSIIVGSLDNIMRPLLIRQGADLSLLLIFAGVIGGLIAFGLVGIFVGPVVLAVAYTLLEAWLGEDPPSASGS